MTGQDKVDSMASVRPDRDKSWSLEESSKGCKKNQALPVEVPEHAFMVISPWPPGHKASRGSHQFADVAVRAAYNLTAVGQSSCKVGRPKVASLSKQVYIRIHCTYCGTVVRSTHCPLTTT